MILFYLEKIMKTYFIHFENTCANDIQGKKVLSRTQKEHLKLKSKRRTTRKFKIVKIDG